MKISERLPLLLLLLASVAGAAEWRRAEPGYVWEFPRDHAAHRDYRTEWWYFTGHLVDRADPERRFGFQFTIFKVGLRPPDGSVEQSAWSSGSALMGHAAITDEREGRHRFSEVLYRENGSLARFGAPGEALIAESRGPAGTPDPWRLRLLDGRRFEIEMSDRRERFALRLATTPQKPMVFHGDAGYSPKSDRPGGAASLYYSFTRLDAAGEVVLDGRSFAVEGQAWMDKEISSEHLEPRQVGWDWWSLQLDDGRELMLFQLRDADGASDYVDGTLVAADGSVRRLDPARIELRAGRRWQSEQSGASYPVEWRLTVDGERLDVVPTVDAQENVGRSFGVHYWEGSLRVLDERGEAVGRGFLEMTGYGEEGRPPI